jgi:hypothetical protein
MAGSNIFCEGIRQESAPVVSSSEASASGNLAVLGCGNSRQRLRRHAVRLDRKPLRHIVASSLTSPDMSCNSGSHKGTMFHIKEHDTLYATRFFDRSAAGFGILGWRVETVDESERRRSKTC